MLYPPLDTVNIVWWSSLSLKASSQIYLLLQGRESGLAAPSLCGTLNCHPAHSLLVGLCSPLIFWTGQEARAESLRKSGYPVDDTSSNNSSPPLNSTSSVAKSANTETEEQKPETDGGGVSKGQEEAETVSKEQDKAETDGRGVQEKAETDGGGVSKGQADGGMEQEEAETDGGGVVAKSNGQVVTKETPTELNSEVNSA